MTNHLIVRAQYVNNHLIITSDDAAVNDDLLIKQKIALLAKEIFSAADSDKLNKQINFYFNENKITAVIKKNNKLSEYNLSANINVLQRAEELAQLISKIKSNHLETSKESNQRTPFFLLKNSLVSILFRWIERSYLYTFTLEPQVDGITHSFFENSVNEINMKVRWRTSHQFLSNTVDELYRQYNEGRKDELFSRDELYQLISKKLEKSFSSHFFAITHTIINKEEMKVLRNERKLFEAISLLQKCKNEEEIQEADRYWSETIDRIPALDFPIEQLALTESNIQTEKKLILSWDRILKDLREKGGLNKIDDDKKQPAELIKQIRFADAYIHACQLLPKEFRDIFQEFHVLDTQRIESFIHKQPNIFELKSIARNQLGKKREEVFLKCIRPIIDKKEEELLAKHLDFLPILQMIADPNSKEINDLVDEMEKSLAKEITMDVREKLDLTREKLIDFLIFDFERIGIEYYLISNAQILHLRQKRESLTIKNQQTEQINQQMNEAIALHSKINEIDTKLKKSNPLNIEEKKSTLLNDYQQLTINLNALKEEIFENVSILDFPIDALVKPTITLSNQNLMIDLWGTLIKKMEDFRSKSTDADGQIHFKMKVLKRLFLNLSTPSKFKYQIGMQLDRFDKPKDEAIEWMNLVYQTANQEGAGIAQWRQDIQKIQLSGIRFDQLAAMPITSTNADLAFDLWSHLLNESLKPFESDLEWIQSTKFMKNLDAEKVKKYEEALFCHENLLEALRNITDPLMIEKIQPLFGLADKVISLKVKNQIISASKTLFPLDKTLELTPVELIIGDVQTKTSPSKELYRKKEDKQLNPYEIQGLLLLTKALASIECRKESLLSTEETKQLEEFIHTARKSGKKSQILKSKLDEMVKINTSDILSTIKNKILGIDDHPYKHIPYGISMHAVEIILGVTKESKYDNQVKILADKLENILDKIDKGESVPIDEKMTYKELGTLTKSINRSNLLVHLKDVITNENNPFNTFNQNSKRAQGLFVRLNQKLNEQAAYRDGDLLTEIGTKEHAFWDHRTTSIEFLQFKLVSPFSHAATIYIEKNQNGKSQIKLSEVLGEYRQNDFQFKDAICSEVWQLDVSKMILEKEKNFLRKAYGNDWNKMIQEKYESLVNNIHKNKNKQFNDLKNSWVRRFEAGKADYILGSHVRKGETEFKLLAKQILGETKDKEDHLDEMICSEFVTSTTLVALFQLNQQLSQEVGDYLINNKQREEGERIKREENILELPISSKEDLSRVHPGRMIDLFKKKQCIKHLDPPAIIQEVVRH